jgi:thiol-disulfide isomerase/thioredoxin
VDSDETGAHQVWTWPHGGIVVNVYSKGETMDLRSLVSAQYGASWRASRLQLLAVALCLTFFSFAVWGQDDVGHSNSDTHPILKIGAHAPDFTLPGIDGKTHSLKDYESSKVLVIIFSCDHCPVAQMYEQRIKKLESDFHNSSVALVVIMGNDPKAVRLSELDYTDVGDSFPEMKIRAKYRNFNYPYLYDGATQAVTLKYGPTATPHAFIFDQQRILRYEGRIDSNPHEQLATKHEARDAIEALLAGKPVMVSDTPTVGCSTKWAYKASTVDAEIAQFNERPVTLDLVSADQIRVLRSNAGTGRLLLVNVWATWCGPCIEEFPELQTMVRMYGLRPIDIVTLSVNNPDEKSMVLTFLQKQHAYNKNLLFNGNDAADAVKAFGTGWTGGAPYTVLIGTDGKVLYKTQGDINVLDVRRAILKSFADDLYLGQHAYWNSTC